jgi:hypothetical protein
MDIVGKARQLERKIARSVDAAVEEFVGRSTPAPLEIIHAVLDSAQQQIQEAGRGRRIFPFNRVTVHVAVGPRDHESRARFAAVVQGPPSLDERLQERLQSSGCRVDAVKTAVVFVSKPGAHWTAPEFHVEFQRTAPEAPAPTPAPAQAPRIKLTVTGGKADQRLYAFTGTRIDIGRRSEVLDARQRLIRTNHVAFAEEGPDVNRSVSRRHAHITYDASGREYRLCDDRSAHGTSVIRKGHTVPVPAGARGVRLQSGDEILLGQARLRVTIEP